MVRYHSPEMVKLAREVNQAAVKEVRLEVREAEADRLPFKDRIFTHAVMTGVFGFITDPVVVLQEIHRVLARNGRFALFTGSPELRGTIAAPEPMASRIRFYEDEELGELARKAGLVDVRIERPNLGSFAREVGIPDEDLRSFSDRGGQLLARKS